MRRDNFQLPLKLETMETLKVFKVWETIQGEGPFSGWPCVFIRLYGCNLMCKNCDTDYTSGFVEVDRNDLVGWIKERHNPSRLVVITGGEPFRQNIGPFIAAVLHLEIAKHVQIETNGTVYQDIPLCDVSVVCSPKTSQIHEDLRPRIRALKYVLSADACDENDGLPTSVLGANITPAKPWRGFRGQVYIMPEDNTDEKKNAANLQAAIDSCTKYGYILSTQIHKSIGVE